MTAAVDVPAGLAAMPPGPALAAVLSGIDLSRVANNELLPVLRAQSRQAAHEQARMLAVIAEVGRAKPTFDDREVARLDHPHQYCADEVRGALAWSLRAADRETDLAEQVVHHLPMVHAAFLAGKIDRPKVWVFAEHLTDLTDSQIRTICAVVVPIAGRLTPGQIAARLRRLILAIDPRHYERRYRKGLRDRRVIGYLAGDGTATITTTGLTPGEGAAALERIDLLARATRNAGHPSTLDQIRVDIVAGLLDGTLHHLRRDAIIAHLLAHRSANDDVPAADVPAADARAGSDSGGGDHARADQRDGDEARPDQRVGVEVRVALSTLLGNDEHPGEIAGWGPVTAQHARDTVARQRRAEWRFVRPRRGRTTRLRRQHPAPSRRHGSDRPSRRGGRTPHPRRLPGAPRQRRWRNHRRRRAHQRRLGCVDR